MKNDGKQAVQLTNNTVPERRAQLSPDGQKVLFTTGSNEQFESYYNNNLFIVPSTGGEPELLLKDWPNETVEKRRLEFAPNS